MPAARVVSDSRPIAQANIAMGLPAVSRKDPDRYALMILNSLLGRGMSSRLFQEVRERRGLAYSVGSSVSRHSDTGMLGISAGVSPENVAETVKVILEELEKLVQEPVGTDELTKARDYTVGSFRLSLESPMSLGQRAGESLLTLGEIEPIESVVDRLRAVTADDLTRVSRRLLRREKAALALVGRISKKACSWKSWGLAPGRVRVFSADRQAFRKVDLGAEYLKKHRNRLDSDLPGV
jgi:predicted Zn-dependent peptidase